MHDATLHSGVHGSFVACCVPKHLNSSNLPRMCRSWLGLVPRVRLGACFHVDDVVRTSTSRSLRRRFVHVFP